jgi:hypothetical protein
LKQTGKEKGSDLEWLEVDGERKMIRPGMAYRRQGKRKDQNWNGFK